MCMCVHVRLFVLVHVRGYVCVCVHVRVYVCVYLCAHVCVHMRACTWQVDRSRGNQISVLIFHQDTEPGQRSHRVLPRHHL